MTLKMIRLCAAAALLSAASVTHAQTAAGTVVLASGFVNAKSPDVTRPLSRGSAVFNGDEISTGQNSYTNIRFSDDGRTLLRPNSRLLIEGYTWPASVPPADKNPSTVLTQDAESLKKSEQAIATEGRSVFRLVRGALRSLTGLIGKANRDNYQMSTPVVTIGIRGTDFGVYHDETSNTTSVSVFNGGVTLTPLGGGAPRNLDAGQSARVDASGAITDLGQPPEELEATAMDDPKNCE